MSLPDEIPASQIALLGIPYDEKSSFMRGPAEAPPKIREALFSDVSHLWSESGFNLGSPEVLFDTGDLALDGKSTEVVFDAIDAAVTGLLERGLTPLILGGDHAISYPIVRAFARKYQRLSVLQFDAHPDLYEEYDGDRYSHACPFARIMEDNLVERLVQVGIRTLNQHQRMQAERFGVEIHEMRNWRENMSLEFDTPLYISFDLDVLDPAFAHGLSHREPGGFSVRQALSILQSLKAPIIGADLVEFNPRQDPVGMTSMVCAKLLKEIGGMMLANRLSIIP